MTQQSEKIPPVIGLDQDIPPEIDKPEGKQSEDLSLEKEKDVSLDIKRFSLGSATLGWCIFLMFFCITLSIWKPDNELIKSGFEAFKLIVMTILGYMFGSQSKT